MGKFKHYKLQMVEGTGAAFQAAVERIKNPDNKVESSNAQKLTLYKYFKQATSGDVTGTQPWAVQVEARAKWDAWNEVKGMSKEDAEKAYVDFVTELLGAA